MKYSSQSISQSDLSNRSMSKCTHQTYIVGMSQSTSEFKLSLIFPTARRQMNNRLEKEVVGSGKRETTRKLEKKA